MNTNAVTQKEVLALLKSGHAHMSLHDAVADFPLLHINDIFPNGEYSFWHLLEHIRRTQNDILEFVQNSNYKDKQWPKDYWPEKGKKATKKDWDTTIRLFEKDLQALIKIVENPKTDLYVKIAWGDGQNILREMLLVADHTSYHIGEFSIMRQVLNLWGKGH